MKITKKIKLQDLATLVCDSLLQAKISVVLTGGSVVSIYTDNEYQSYDLDFISEATTKEINFILKELGFIKEGRYFKHLNTEFFVEFPSPPLAIGNEFISEWGKQKNKEWPPPVVVSHSLCNGSLSRLLSQE